MRSNLRHDISGLALISAYDKNISTRLKTELCSSDTNNYSYAKDVSTRNGVKSEHRCTSWGYQFKVLLLRGLKERRYETFNKLRVFQVVSVAFLAGLLWWHKLLIKMHTWRTMDSSTQKRSSMA
ncbi:hypothetical protein KY290_021272 [Solanum tuberosum]|uniref:Uncharacterized protein n=1 Tax=Solanum tuberosum TaxID=4113 RepID=A0ABQ7V2L9_SOLTU|nr:hypothetical protein KY285_020192 [Solanum tuberosum]KAH0757779.1 hypothetical protein KY290_021272 [Solanum tuberosum]